MSTLDQQPPLSTPRVVDYLRVAEPAPVVLAYGMGVGSTALLVELESRGTRCTARIEAAGLPVPPKSSCFICGAMKPDEVHALPAWCLRLIILVEARAAPRLRTVEGLWRKSTRTRPGRMTDFIRAEALLPGAEIDAIIRDAPAGLPTA